MPRLRTCGPLVCLALFVAGCIKIEQRQTTASGVPAVLLGHWTGSWTSEVVAAGPGSHGDMALRVQEFGAQPVLRVDTDNPCIYPANYEFARQGVELELRADGVPVFRAVLDPDQRTVTGVYTCEQDHGSWTVRWDRDLPAIGDVTGTWVGTVSGGRPTRTLPLQLELEQTWSGGLLAVGGTVRIPDLQFEQPLSGGLVEWHEEQFDLALRVDGTIGFALLLQGVGSNAQMSLSDGLAIAQDPRVPFATGLWSATHTGN